MTDDGYITDDARGDGWHLMLGDACERIGELEPDSVDLSVFSPPFASLYTYSPSLRDLGNSFDRDEFFEHFAYVIRGLLNATKPGRLACVHVQQLTTSKATHGVIGATDFRGQVIAAFQKHGWTYYGDITIDKDPQAQAIRTKAVCLMFVTLERDQAVLRPALADYLLVFKKPGENRVPVRSDVDRDTWIKWAHPVWYDISETDTLNVRVARDDADERHICPLQLPLIERCVRLWSNPGELVFSPFAGIGSEGYVALRRGRRFTGIELKASYWRTAVETLRAVTAQTALEVGA
jgi:DNA modification methylase